MPSRWCLYCPNLLHTGYIISRQTARSRIASFTLMQGKVKVSKLPIRRWRCARGRPLRSSQDKIVVLRLPFILRLAGRRFRYGSGYAGWGDGDIGRGTTRPWSSRRRIWISSSTSLLPQGKPAGNHHGVERDGCGKSQNRKGKIMVLWAMVLLPIPYSISRLIGGRINPYSVSFEGSRWEKVMIFPCFAACNGGGSHQPLPSLVPTLSSFNVQQTCISSAYTLALFHNEVAFLRFIEVEYPVPSPSVLSKLR